MPTTLTNAVETKKTAEEEPRNKNNALPHVPGIVPILNNVTRAMLRLGVPMGPATLLKVRGRKTGKLRRQPIGYFRDGGKLYLFSTFGETNWVRNVRAAGGRVEVGTGWKTKKALARELAPEEAAPIIKRSIAPHLSNPFAKLILGPHVAVSPDAPLAEYVKEAERHPVFELEYVPPPSGTAAAPQGATGRRA
jgi:deazaflavin-dependent oxidoreductase (nitroreductase family)